MNVVISPNPYRDKQFKHTMRVKQMLEESGVTTKICLPFQVDQVFELPQDIVFADMLQSLDDCDVLICLGGDGTILHASKLAAARDIPILGINIGTLGFMAELEAWNLQSLKTLKDCTYKIEERMMLEVNVISGDKVIYTDYALNDAVITKGAVARVLQMKVCCNDSEVQSFSGDGVILSTPTGSTAYSLSAGGPIVEPTAENILITPICAHGPNTNCIVTAPSRVVSVTVDRTGRRNAFLSVDGGRTFRLDANDKVTVKRAERVTKLIRLSDQDFFQTITRKFSSR